MLRTFVDFENVAIYTLYPESFCVKNPAVRKVFVFYDSAPPAPSPIPATASFLHPLHPLSLQLQPQANLDADPLETGELKRQVQHRVFQVKAMSKQFFSTFYMRWHL